MGREGILTQTPQQPSKRSVYTRMKLLKYFFKKHHQKTKMKLDKEMLSCKTSAQEAEEWQS